MREKAHIDAGFAPGAPQSPALLEVLHTRVTSSVARLTGFPAFLKRKPNLNLSV